MTKTNEERCCPCRKPFGNYITDQKVECYLWSNNPFCICDCRYKEELPEKGIEININSFDSEITVAKKARQAINKSRKL